jgi:cytochrome c553
MQKHKIVLLAGKQSGALSMLKPRHLILAFAALFAVSNVATAEGPGHKIVTQGNGKGATACVACHGANGEGQAQAGYPKLAGLNQAYLAKQLHDFSSNSRKNPIMDKIAKALTKKEIKAVTAYYAAQTPPSKQDKATADSGIMEVGKDLAMNGNWPNDVPSCFACHGISAQGVGSTFPTLAGQHAKYIENQLQAWKSGQRHNDPNGLMEGIAKRLDHDQVMAVSAYLASLSTSHQ